MRTRGSWVRAGKWLGVTALVALVGGLSLALSTGGTQAHDDFAVNLAISPKTINEGATKGITVTVTAAKHRNYPSKARDHNAKKIEIDVTATHNQTSASADDYSVAGGNTKTISLAAGVRTGTATFTVTATADNEDEPGARGGDVVRFVPTGLRVVRADGTIEIGNHGIDDVTSSNWDRNLTILDAPQAPQTKAIAVSAVGDADGVTLRFDWPDPVGCTNCAAYVGVYRFKEQGTNIWLMTSQRFNPQHSRQNYAQGAYTFRIPLSSNGLQRGKTYEFEVVVTARRRTGAQERITWAQGTATATVSSQSRAIPSVLDLRGGPADAIGAWFVSWTEGALCSGGCTHYEVGFRKASDDDVFDNWTFMRFDRPGSDSAARRFNSHRELSGRRFTDPVRVRVSIWNGDTVLARGEITVIPSRLKPISVTAVGPDRSSQGDELRQTRLSWVEPVCGVCSGTKYRIRYTENNPDSAVARWSSWIEGGNWSSGGATKEPPTNPLTLPKGGQRYTIEVQLYKKGTSSQGFRANVFFSGRAQARTYEATETTRPVQRGGGAPTNDDQTQQTNRPPVFSSNTVTRSVAENSPAGTKVGAALPQATDPDGDRLTYSLGGTDAGLFDFNSSSRQLTVRSGTVLNYEATKNSYMVTITASDPGGATGTLTVTINVTNVEEAGSVSLALTMPKVGTALAASVDDPDGSVSGVTWQWAKSATQGGAYANISGATSASYTPAAADVGKWLRATASYTDGQGSGKSASGTAAVVVAANQVPDFSPAMVTREVAENSPAGAKVGAALPQATDPDGDKLAYSLGGTDAGSFDFNSTTRQLTVRSGTDLNYEATQNTYTLTLTATDGGRLTGALTVIVNVSDVAEPPGRPAAPIEIAAARSSLTVKWTAPSNTGPAISDYDVRYREGTSGEWTDHSHTGLDTTATITGLGAGKSYQIQVRATNAEGTGEWSEALNAFTSEERSRVPAEIELELVVSPYDDGRLTSPESATELQLTYRVNVLDKDGHPVADGTQVSWGLPYRPPAILLLALDEITVDGRAEARFALLGPEPFKVSATAGDVRATMDFPPPYGAPGLFLELPDGTVVPVISRKLAP